MLQPSLSPARCQVADNVLLDGRLALFHQRERWLAVADLHFGYELSQRAAGALVPLWGMRSIEERLSELLNEYVPTQLLILGDLVHDRTAAGEARLLVARLEHRCEIVLIAGNHDRKLGAALAFTEAWRTNEFHFHHGDCATADDGRVQIIGHHHPSGTVSDGAGLRLKLPAFVQQPRCWIVPAFSPWAAGVTWPRQDGTRMWLCTPGRILGLDGANAVAV